MSKSKTKQNELEKGSGTVIELAESQKKEIVSKTKKPKRNWVPNPQENFGQEKVQPGDNRRYLRFSRLIANLPPIDISDPAQVEMRINEYFDYCEKNDMKPGMVGMASALGVEPNTLSSWKRGDFRGSTHSPVIKKAVMLLESMWEGYMQNGKVNPASGIFLAKNMFGYRDVIDLAPAQPQPLGELADQKALEAKIEADIVDED